MYRIIRSERIYGDEWRAVIHPNQARLILGCSYSRRSVVFESTFDQSRYRLGSYALQYAIKSGTLVMVCRYGSPSKGIFTSDGELHWDLSAEFMDQMAGGSGSSDACSDVVEDEYVKRIEKPVQPLSLIPGTEPDFIRIVCVDTLTRKAVPHIKATYILDQGSSFSGVSCVNGYLRFERAPKGNFDLKGADPVKESLALTKSCSPVAIRMAGAQELAELNKSRSSAKTTRVHWQVMDGLVTVEKLKVSKGALFSRIAIENELTFDALSKFNFGTTSAKKIKEQMKLRFKTGADKGREYELNEGIVYVPKPFIKRGLKTGITYLMEVEHVGRHFLAVEVKTAAGNPVFNIELTLELTDGFRIKSMTGKDGLVRFNKVPVDPDGEIIFTDEEQVLHHALAADLYGAIATANTQLCINTLKNVMAFYYVEKVYQQIYRKKAKQCIIDAFPEHREISELLYVAGCRKRPRNPDYTPYIGDTVVLRGVEHKTVLAGVGASKGLLTKEEIDAVIRNAKNKSEAFGIMGKEMAKKRAGHITDPRYIDRYHGPDDMTEGPDGKLTEWEAKGWQSDTHQDIRMNSPARTSTRLTQRIQKQFSILIGPINRLLMIPSAHLTCYAVGLSKEDGKSPLVY